MGKAQVSLLNRISYTISLILVFAFLVHGQSELFMNIDCGKPSGYHGTDSLTGLTYESDYNYVETGVTYSISSSFQGPGVPSQANDLRSFPNGTRNCYTLTPVSPGKKYLIRASFLYGNYDGKSSFPKFELYLGTILWETISISSSSFKYDTMIYSFASSDYMFVCLKDIASGTPFISSLELRPLDDDVYRRHLNATNPMSMVSVDLVNFGASADPVVRYPKDAYDRVWRSYAEPGWTELSTSSDVGVDDVFKPPLVVMQTAVAPTSGSTLKFSTQLGDQNEFSNYLVFMHFAELQVPNQNASRRIKISRNGIDIICDGIASDTLSTNSTICTSNPTHYEKLDHSLYMTNGSTLPPTINAMEVYRVRESKQVSTNSKDVDAIRDIKLFYHLKKDWTGDPCAPREFTWNGLVCNDDSSPRITTLNLRASGLNDLLRRSICCLTALQELDLSTNKLTGAIPSCLAELQQLTLLNITNSGLKGPVPQALLNKWKNGPLQIFYDNPEGASSVEKKSNVLVVAISTSLSIALLVFIAFGIFWNIRRHKHQKQGLSEENQNKQLNGQVFPPNNSNCRQFTYSELAEITNNFSKMVGQGGFGSVYYGILPNKLPVAVKILSEASCQGPREFQRESQLLRKIHHRNLVPFVGYCNDEGHLALVYEYMSQGDLASRLSGHQAHPLCWRDRLRIANEAAQGFEYLHKGCADTILHRDIKTSNILLDQHFEAKIADFGLSRACDNDNFTQVTTAIMGTRGYLDPFSVVLDQRSDVYAFGVVLLELITGQPAIIQQAGGISLTEWAKEHYKRGELGRIVDNRLQECYNSNAVSKALETAMACLSPDTDGRPDMTRVLSLLKECWEMELSNFTSSSNYNTTVRSNFTSEFFKPGCDSMEFGPSIR